MESRVQIRRGAEQSPQRLGVGWKQLRLRHLGRRCRRGVAISRTVVASTSGLVEKPTKTHQLRRVAIGESTAAVLRAHRSRCVEIAVQCEVPLGDDAFVFSSDAEGCRCWHPDSASRRFRQLADRLGLRRVRLHDLRHYVASQLLAGGVDVRTVAGRLGHRDASTTLNVYSHFLPEADQRAADLLASLLADA